MGEARHATLPFPFGRWVNQHCSFDITLEGTFEQRAGQRTIRGQLRKDAKNPWRPRLRGMFCVPSKACEPWKNLLLQNCRWTGELTGDRRITFDLTEECVLRGLCRFSDGKELKTRSDHAGSSHDLMRELPKARHSWESALNGIIECVLGDTNLADDTLLRCVQAIHEVFQLVDEFNTRYKAHKRFDNPEFDAFMQQVAESTSKVIRTSSRSARLVLSTHFIRCLFQRLVYISKRTYYLWRETTVYGALKQCRDNYGEMLRASQGQLHALMGNLGERNLRLLRRQLEALAEREEEEVKELPYARLLEMAAEISTRLHQVLPLTDGDFNLEYLLYSSANQAPDRATFHIEVAPYMGLAATSACDRKEAAARLADSWA